MSPALCNFEKLVSQSWRLFVVPRGSQQLVLLNDPGFSDAEAHASARAPVRSCRPTVRAAPD